MVFNELEDLVEMARSATEDAMLGSMTTIQELLHRETDWWNEANDTSNPSNADITRESNDSGDDTPGDDISKDESFCIRDLFTTTSTGAHEEKTEDNGSDGPSYREPT